MVSSCTYAVYVAEHSCSRIKLYLFFLCFDPANFQVIINELILDEEQQIKYKKLFQLYNDLIPHFERDEKFTRDQIGDFARKQSLFYESYIATCGYESELLQLRYFECITHCFVLQSKGTRGCAVTKSCPLAQQ